MAHSILILNGPNLNLLGSRENDVYGTQSLDAIMQACATKADSSKLKIEHRQSNHEGELVDWIQQANTQHAGLILNAGAYTHTSVAIHDALRTLDIPIIEVHLSNIYQREPFRHHSYVSPVAHGVICGLGANSYLLAIDAIAQLIKQ